MKNFPLTRRFQDKSDVCSIWTHNSVAVERHWTCLISGCDGTDGGNESMNVAKSRRHNLIENKTLSRSLYSHVSRHGSDSINSDVFISFDVFMLVGINSVFPFSSHTFFMSEPEIREHRTSIEGENMKPASEKYMPWCLLSFREAHDGSGRENFSLKGELRKKKSGKKWNDENWAI